MTILKNANRAKWAFLFVFSILFKIGLTDWAAAQNADDGERCERVLSRHGSDKPGLYFFTGNQTLPVSADSVDQLPVIPDGKLFYVNNVSLNHGGVLSVRSGVKSDVPENSVRLVRRKSDKRIIADCNPTGNNEDKFANDFNLEGRPVTHYLYNQWLASGIVAGGDENKTTIHDFNFKYRKSPDSNVCDGDTNLHRNRMSFDFSRVRKNVITAGISLIKFRQIDKQQYTNKVVQLIPFERRNPNSSYCVVIHFPAPIKENTTIAVNDLLDGDKLVSMQDYKIGEYIDSVWPGR